MLDLQVKVSNRSPKNQDNKKVSKKQSRKGENPTRFTPQSSDAYTNTRVCSNSACKAVLCMDKSFCQRCSCCFCHKFDDNKDPSLWLVCGTDRAQNDSCGLACHIECAFQHEKVGVVNLGQFMQLDGSYWCGACGKVSDILGCWKKQLCIAKDAPRVEDLCHRIALSYRLLNGSSRFKALHDIIKDAKNKLEDKLGPINKFSHTIGRGLSTKLHVTADVQKLCADAIAMADDWLANASNWRLSSIVDPMAAAAACRFRIEDVDSSSVTIALIEIPTALTEYVKGYKLWYWRTGHESSPTKPVCSFTREQTRIVINDLLSCTEYTFRIVSFTESHDLGNSEAICFTKSLDINCKNSNASGMVGFQNKNRLLEGDKEQCHGVTPWAKENKEPAPVPLELDLNVALVPDLNEEVTPVFESSGDEDNGYSMDRTVVAKSQVEAARVPRKRSFGGNDEMFDCDSTLVNGSLFRMPVPNFEGCVKTVRSLECQGHVKQDFRLKFLTWFSLGSTEQERQIVHTFIRTLSDEPKILAGQLVDSFADIITIKRPRHSYSGNHP